MKSHSFLSQIVPIAAGALLAVAATRPSQARACTIPAPEPGFEHGAPEANAIDVPTDVILYYPTPLAVVTEGDGVPGTYALRAEEGGAQAAITARRAGEWGYELVPDEPLAPNTAYVLTGTWMLGTTEVSKTLRFTTGAGPLQEVPSAPAAKMEHYRIVQQTISTCGPPLIGSCLSFGGPDALIEITHIDEFNQLTTPYLARSSFLTNLSGIDQGTNFKCVRLRTRAANGTYGDEQTLCGDDAELSEVTSERVECTEAGLTVSGMLLEREDGEMGGATAGTGGGGAVDPIGSGGSPATPDAGLQPRDDDDEDDVRYDADEDAAEEPTKPVVTSSSCAVSMAPPAESRARVAGWLLALSAAVVLARRRRTGH